MVLNIDFKRNCGQINDFFWGKVDLTVSSIFS